jgi:hypothetical protein
MLAPQGTQQAPQLPQFVGRGAAPAPMQAPQGKPAKPVVHGLLSADDIDGRLSTMPPAAQNYVKKAIATLGPDLPTLMGIIIGPEAHDYFELALQTMQQASQQQNSQAAPADAGAAQNPQAPAPDAAAGGQPAMATPGADTTA